MTRKLGPGLVVLACLALLMTVGLVGVTAWTQAPPESRSAAAAAAAANVRESPTPQALDSPSPSPATNNIYAATTGSLSQSVAVITPRVYVPNNGSNTIDVIDPITFQVVDHYAVGQGPHHIAPAWDLSELYVDNELSSTLTVIDIHTGKPVRTIPVVRPYNLYFTPDGQKAVVVAEAFDQLVFYDAHTWQMLKAVQVPGLPHPGVDHLDFSADGSFLIASTEYSGQLVKVDVAHMQITAIANFGGLPVDVRLAPDGSVFYVTNQGRNGISIIDPATMKELAFLPTGKGAHGLEVSRDTTKLYISNRMEGSISVLDFASRQIVATWRIGGSPDMMQLSPDGQQLWASGRFDGQVYVVDTVTGKLLHSIRVGAQPHGLTYFPSPGRFSIGHNGVYR